MTDRPIIFSVPMVRALLDGRKSQTRRLAWKPQGPMTSFSAPPIDPSPWQRVQPGHRLWVRENWQSDVRNFDTKPNDIRRTEPVWFAAGGEPVNGPGEFAVQATGWRPSIHMPRWASRLTLTVTAVKVERLQEISDDDAAAEGVSSEWDDYERYGQSEPYRYGFSALWNHLHGPDAWDANPEVVALAFTVERRNIDAR